MSDQPSGPPRALPQMLNLQDVRDALGISRGTLMRLVETGELPATKVGAAYRFWAADVALFLERNRVETTTTVAGVA